MVEERLPRDSQFVDVNYTISLKPETTPHTIEELDDDVT
jgi:hypothetical protein